MSAHTLLPGRQKGLPPEESLSFGAPFLIWCFLLCLQPRQAASTLPHPHLHPPRSLGASEQFWLCPGGSGATPCSGRQDLSVSLTSGPLKEAASRCPWKAPSEEVLASAKTWEWVTGSHAQLLPARHTHPLHGRGAGSQALGACPSHRSRASPRPGFRGSPWAGTEGSGHVRDSHLTPGSVCLHKNMPQGFQIKGRGSEGRGGGRSHLWLNVLQTWAGQEVRPAPVQGRNVQHSLPPHPHPSPPQEGGGSTEGASQEGPGRAATTSGWGPTGHSPWPLCLSLTEGASRSVPSSIPGSPRAEWVGEGQHASRH